MANSEWRMVRIAALMMFCTSLFATRHSLFAYLPRYTSITRSFDET
ncbi:hypothetical protein V1283_006896 [Bradyrhizobium sp. AZCC 2262]